MNHSQACEILGIKDGADPETIRRTFEKLNSDITRQIETAGSKFLRDTLVKNRKALSEAYQLLIGDSSTDGSLAFNAAYKLLMTGENDTTEDVEERFLKLKEEYSYGLRSPNIRIREIAAADLKVLSDVFEHIIANIKKPADAVLPHALIENIREEERASVREEFREKFEQLKKEHSARVEVLEDRISSLSSEKTRFINDLTGILKLLAEGNYEDFINHALELEERYGVTGLSSIPVKKPGIRVSGERAPIQPPAPEKQNVTRILYPETSGFGLEEINIELTDDHLDRMILKQSKVIDGSRPLDPDRTIRSEDGPLNSRSVAEKLFSEGRYEESLYYFREAKEVEPKDYSLDVYINELEHLIAQETEKKEAPPHKPQEDYEKVAYEETLKVANALRSQKNFAEALEIYSSLLISDPENPYLLYCRSECEDGIKRTRETASIPPPVKRPTITELLTLKSEGDDLMNRKEFGQALEVYEKALQINPKDLYVQIMIDQCKRELSKN